MSMSMSSRRVLFFVGVLAMTSSIPAQEAAKGFTLVEAEKVPGSPEDLAAGKDLYAKACDQCHGPKGDGEGLMADLLIPRPRNFLGGIFKVRTTPSGDLPTDRDLFRVISQGMPGTSMPAWEGLLSEQQIWQLVHYVKTFSPDFVEYPPEKQLELTGKIPSSEESIAKGAEIYIAADCVKCHGVAGRADGPSSATLKDDWEFAILPRDLTQPWEFRGGGTVEDIYRTFTLGMNGSPMPSYAEGQTSDELWHLANYVRSLGRDRALEEVIVARRVEQVPEDCFSEVWDQLPPVDFPLAGQIIQEPRLFNPSQTNVTVKAVYSDSDLALLLSWTDRTHDTGQESATQNGDPIPPPDQVAVQFPARPASDAPKPYFVMGDRKNPVDHWRWSARSGGVTEVLLAHSMDDSVAKATPVVGVGEYKDGQYRVVLRRSLQSPGENDARFTPGEFTAIAFQLWDGTNGEQGKKRAISRWYYILLETETPWTVWVWPAIVALLTVVLQGVGLRRLRSKWKEQ